MNSRIKLWNPTSVDVYSCYPCSNHVIRERLFVNFNDSVDFEFGSAVLVDGLNGNHSLDHRLAPSLTLLESLES